MTLPVSRGNHFSWSSNGLDLSHIILVYILLLQSATIYPPAVSSGKPLMPCEVSLKFVVCLENLEYC